MPRGMLRKELYGFLTLCKHALLRLLALQALGAPLIEQQELHHFITRSHQFYMLLTRLIYPIFEITLAFTILYFTFRIFSSLIFVIILDRGPQVISF